MNLIWIIAILVIVYCSGFRRHELVKKIQKPWVIIVLLGVLFLLPGIEGLEDGTGESKPPECSNPTYKCNGFKCIKKNTNVCSGQDHSDCKAEGDIWCGDSCTTKFMDSLCINFSKYYIK